MKQINYRGQWYSIGDTINLGTFFPDRWKIIDIHHNCSCTIVKNGKRKTLIGSVKIPEVAPAQINTIEFNNWMYYIHMQRR